VEAEIVPVRVTAVRDVKKEGLFVMVGDTVAAALVVRMIIKGV